jgi:hypothetical protein
MKEETSLRYLDKNGYVMYNGYPVYCTEHLTPKCPICKSRETKKIEEKAKKELYNNLHLNIKL